MATSDTRLITVKCDINGCTESIACGSDPLWPVNHGWVSVNVTTQGAAGDRPLYMKFEGADLCPQHAQDLYYFMTVGEAEVDEDEDDDPEPQLIDVAAGGDWAGIPTPSTSELTEVDK